METSLIDNGARLNGAISGDSRPQERLPALGLVGDVGGTNARFALAEEGPEGLRLAAYRSLLCADHDSLESALAAYLKDVGLAAAPARSVVAVAGPVVDGTIKLTNLRWATSEADLTAAGLGPVRLINDYEALALGAAHYGPADLRHAGGPRQAEPDHTLAVMGPGTGFGASALARSSRAQVVMATEGGHIGFAPYDALEMEVLKVLAGEFGRVSVERILSGPGLASLHAALCLIHGETPVVTDPSGVTRAANQGEPTAVRTLNVFCAILGGVAGDLALALGARGGVFIGGGIAPAIADQLVASPFRRRFEAKGRLSPYVEAIPTWIITHPQAALISGATLLR